MQDLEKIHALHNDLLFLCERRKIEKVENLAANLIDKNEYVIHIRNLKQTLKLHRIIKLSQESWLRPYIHMYTDLRKN